MSSENLSDWFRHQLQASADGFVWAVEQVPAARRFVSPPNLWGLGEWTVARHAFHMVYYDEGIALPSMRQWLGAQIQAFDEDGEDAAWGDGQDLDTLLTRFRATRAEQIALMDEFDSELWEEARDAPWGSVNLRWVVSKTYQHTLEHTHNILQIALFWDFAARALQAQAT